MTGQSQLSCTRWSCVQFHKPKVLWLRLFLAKRVHIGWRSYDLQSQEILLTILQLARADTTALIREDNYQPSKINHSRMILYHSTINKLQITLLTIILTYIYYPITNQSINPEWIYICAMTPVSRNILIILGTGMNGLTRPAETLRTQAVQTAWRDLQTCTPHQSNQTN